MKVTVNTGMSDISCAEWNQLGGDRFPFLRHEFLDAAERSGFVAEWLGRILGSGKIFAKAEFHVC